MVVLAGAFAVAACFLAWTFWQRSARLARELDQSERALAAANEDLGRLEASFASASVIHDLWGMGARFGEGSASVCAVYDDKRKVRSATVSAVEMWSDSAVRSEINLERAFLPVLRGLERQGFHVTGASLPAGVVAQYRRFRRDALGDVIMLDPSRIVDAQGRSAVLEFLRRAGEGQLDPAKTTVVYRLDEYGKVSYPLLHGSADQPLLQAGLSTDPLAKPVTVTVAEFPCS